jgi:hypothetical protein
MHKYAKFFRSNNFLILNKDFLTLLNDLNTAVYLSYLIDKYVYFTTNNMITYFEGKEFFFNIQKEIELEIFLSPKQQRSCLENLQKYTIVETKLKGIPAKTFFHIDFNILYEFIENCEITINKEKAQQDVTKGHNYKLQKGTYITNNKELITNTNNKNNKNSQINELICHQQNEINKIFDGIFDLSVKYSFDNLVNPDATQKLNDLLKSENMNKLKKTYLDIKKENTLEKKTYKNVLQYHKDNLKINCLSSIWLYDYEILKLRMKYNADYLLDTLYKCDLWLQDPTNFTKRIDHYSFIENWIKRDIGKKLEIKTHIQVDRYKYVNWGVDYDLFK